MTAHAKPPKAESETLVLQIRKIGNSTGVILPKELLVRLGWETGDELAAGLTADGGFLLQRRQTEYKRAMVIVRRIME